MEETIRAALSHLDAHRGKVAESLLRPLLSGAPLSAAEEARIRYILGLALLDSGSAEDACRELEASSSLFRQSGGTSAALALAVTAHARAELACGRTEKSLILGTEARPLLEASLGGSDTRLAASLFSLSFAEYSSRHFEAAEELVSKAMRIWQSASGPECPEVTTCLNNLGRICEETGRTDEGIALHRKALDIRRKTLGDHTETAFSMGNLGVALAAAGRWREAADMLEAALACYARCGRTEGDYVEGYRYNLDICRKALSE